MLLFYIFLFVSVFFAVVFIKQETVCRISPDFSKLNSNKYGVCTGFTNFVQVKKILNGNKTKTVEHVKTVNLNKRRKTTK